MIIGLDKARNEFVEVLAGAFKGYIGSIDHDLYSCYDTIEELFDEMDLGNYETLNNAEKETALMDQEFGLISLHAKSMNEFLENCFIYKENDILIKNLD